jgi:hypothetical protein
MAVLGFISGLVKLLIAAFVPVQNAEDNRKNKASGSQQVGNPNTGVIYSKHIF